MKKTRQLFRFCLNLGLFCVLLAVLTIPVQAKDARLVDEASLLTASEAETVLARLDEVSEAYEMDVVILTVNSLGGKDVVAYADDYYDEHDYGYGASKDGLLLLVSMADRDWAISTTGQAIPTFTDAGQSYMQQRFLPSLSDGDYEKAFLTFTNLCEEFMKEAENGQPYDGSHMPSEPLGLPWYLAALAIGAVLAQLIMSVLKGQLKSVRSKRGAVDYVRDGSFVMNREQDLFLYDRVTKVPKPKQNSGGGGSSTHVGSSGTTHGGSHGKF